MKNPFESSTSKAGSIISGRLVAATTITLHRFQPIHRT